MCAATLIATANRSFMTDIGRTRFSWKSVGAVFVGSSNKFGVTPAGPRQILGEHKTWRAKNLLGGPFSSPIPWIPFPRAFGTSLST